MGNKYPGKWIFGISFFSFGVSSSCVVLNLPQIFLLILSARNLFISSEDFSEKSTTVLLQTLQNAPCWFDVILFQSSWHGSGMCILNKFSYSIYLFSLSICTSAGRVLFRHIQTI